MKIQNLTAEQCIHIAKIAEPTIDWNFVENQPNKWDGFDLLGEKQEDGSYDGIFQISFSGHFSFFDEGLNEYKVSGQEKQQIIKYLESL